MTRIILIASILLAVAAATAYAARYGEGEGLDPGSEGTKVNGAASGTADSGFSGVNNPTHTGVNPGQPQTGTYGSH